MTISYCDVCKKVLKRNHYSIEMTSYGFDTEHISKLSEICVKCAGNILKVLKDNKIILKRKVGCN